MKILEPQSAVLTNAEVLSHLNDIQAKRRLQAGGGVPPFKSPNFEAMMKEVSTYLNPPNLPPAGNTVSPMPRYATGYDALAINRCMERLEGYRFTRAELLMIVNLRPTNAPRLDAIVEELDTRLTPEQQAKVLTIINESLSWDGYGGERELDLERGREREGGEGRRRR